MTVKKNPDLEKPFHVVHSNGDLIKGFLDEVSAIKDAEERNIKAEKLGIKSCYKSISKP